MHLTKPVRIEILVTTLLWTIFFGFRYLSGQGLTASIMDFMLVVVLFNITVFYFIASIPYSKRRWYVQTIQSLLFYLLLSTLLFVTREYLMVETSPRGFFFGAEQGRENSAWLILTKYYFLPFSIYFFIALAYGFIRKFVLMPYNPSLAKDLLVIKSGSETYRIPKNKITHIKGEGNYLSVHWANRHILSLLSFDEILKMLDAPNFVRIHRSYIVNTDFIEQMSKDKLTIGQFHLPISKSYRPDLKVELQTNVGH